MVGTNAVAIQWFLVPPTSRGPGPSEAVSRASTRSDGKSHFRCHVAEPKPKYDTDSRRVTGGHVMTTPHPGQTELEPAGVRRLGYGLAIAFSIGILVGVNNLPEGNQIPFLTDDLEQLLPIINGLLLTSIGINGIWILYDAAWFRSAGRITLNVLLIAVLALTYRVFPFDFAAYDFDWESLIRLFIVAVIVALTIATIVEIVKLIGRFVNY